MGQQQLLLLVLGIVIVGLAVVVGIQAFGENQKKANADALVNDGVRIASDAQAWKLRPGAFGGGADVAGMTGFSFQQAGYTVNADGDYRNHTGTFTIAATAASLIITGQSLASTGNNNEVQIGVFGTTPECIATAVGPVDGVTTPAKPAGCVNGAF
jgi:hypothetical protein